LLSRESAAVNDVRGRRANDAAIETNTM